MIECAAVPEHRGGERILACLDGKRNRESLSPSPLYPDEGRAMP